MQSKSHASFPTFFSSHSHKTLVGRGIYPELVSTGLYPPHITLPLPCDHFPYLQTPKCQSRSKMHSSGESRLECSFRNKHLREEKKSKHFAWGTGTIHTPSLSTSRTQKFCRRRFLQFQCAEFPSLLPPQLPGGCCKGVTSRLPAHPNRPPTMVGVNSVHPRHSSC